MVFCISLLVVTVATSFLERARPARALVIVFGLRARAVGVAVPQGVSLVSVWALRTRANPTGPAVPGGSNWGGELTFVSDTGHKWKVDVEKSKTTPTKGRG
jgi:hypothetical protein